MIAQPLVVNFVVFRREVELQSFYSSILILSVCGFFILSCLTFYQGETPPPWVSVLLPSLVEWGHIIRRGKN